MAVPVQVLRPREVPLGGPRAMTVRRTLPARERSFVGAWCFVDHYGPDDVSVSGGMDVAPHPHCGLATVSWLFSGEVEHRDSLGTRALVRPGEVNLMTAGRGISHSEVSTPETTVLHGAQLWVALPTRLADVAPRFEHHEPGVVAVGDGVRAQVFVGSLWGSASPVRVESPLVDRSALARRSQGREALELATQVARVDLDDELAWSLDRAAAPTAPAPQRANRGR